MFYDRAPVVEALGQCECDWNPSFATLHGHLHGRKKSGSPWNSERCMLQTAFDPFHYFPGDLSFDLLYLFETFHDLIAFVRGKLDREIFSIEIPAEDFFDVVPLSFSLVTFLLRNCIAAPMLGEFDWWKH